jgi:RNA polymerase sigma factor (sigma-70 family)
MTAVSPDGELVSAYAAQGSETAFRALVARHVDLVFATALRQTGNAALAEEITQNVFISLAKKAPRLAGVQTLAGWLYRATLLETKARIRSELRRRQREQTASEIITLEHQGASPFAALLPLLDEALLDMRESDRLALVLRFMENRSLREVGVVLGVEEDTARKRVSRALGRLGEFFRRRGFAIPAAGGGAGLLSTAAQAAPPALAASCGGAAIAAGGAASGVNSIIFHIMKLTKTQMAAAAVLLVSAPLAWQHFTQSALAREQAAVDAQIASATRRAEDLEASARQTRQAAERTQADAASLQHHLDALHGQLAGSAARPAYHWDDNSPYARLSKSVLGNGTGLGAIRNRRGLLSEHIKQLLQMTPGEAVQSQAAVTHFLSAYEAGEAANMRQVPPNADDLQGHAADQTRVFDVPYIGSNQMTELRQDFFGQVTSILGDERGGMFTNALAGWMPVTEDYRGISSEEAVFNSSFRARFYQPAPGDKMLQFSVSNSTHGWVSGSMPPDDVPLLYQPYLQDWLSTMQNQAP